MDPKIVRARHVKSFKFNDADITGNDVSVLSTCGKLVAIGTDFGLLTLYDTQQSHIQSYEFQHPGDNDAVRDIQFSPGIDQLLVCDSKCIHVMSVNPLTVLKQCTSMLAVRGAIFSPDMKWIIVAISVGALAMSADLTQKIPILTLKKKKQFYRGSNQS